MPIKIIQKEKEGHRKVKTPKLKKRPDYGTKKSDLHGTLTYKKGGRTGKASGGRIGKQLGGGFNQPLGGMRAPVGAMGPRRFGMKHGSKKK